ncbi:TPA: YraN family protein, partial [Pseudomonas aeruginosa]
LFLQQEARWAKRPCRFDVVTVDTSDGQSPPRLDWIQNAFDA